MPLRNRVSPFGDIVAVPSRGLFMGNRGILHDATRQLGTARWRHRNWIICTLTPRGPPRVPMTPNRYTELFFLDEATALAAGHRPCAECRRSDFRRFAAAWGVGHHDEPPPMAPGIDRALHAARLTPRREQRVARMPLAELPPGAIVRWSGEAWLVTADRLLHWTFGGYDRAERRPSAADVDVLTPVPTLAALRSGYRPVLHPSAET